MNGTKFVSPEVRERVLLAMRELNYFGNAHARQLARGTSDYVGLIVSDIENPFLPKVIKSFERSAQERGFGVLMSTTNYKLARMERALRTMISNRVAAVAVMTSNVDSLVSRMLGDAAIPSVFLDGAANNPSTSSIRLDYSIGANDAVARLAELGHQTAAMVAGPQTRASHVAFLQAVRAACHHASLRLQVLEADNTVEGGERTVPPLLGMEPRPTAVICSNDLTAIGVLRGLKRAGVYVPRHVSLVGADDIFFAELTDPPLSTIRIPREELGARAFNILERSIRSGVSINENLATSFVGRGSIGTAPSGV